MIGFYATKKGHNTTTMLLEDLVSRESVEIKSKQKSDKVTSQSMPNLAFIDTNEVMNDSINDRTAIRIPSHNEVMVWGCYHCQVHHQDWPKMHPPADNLMVKISRNDNNYDAHIV